MYFFHSRTHNWNTRRCFGIKKRKSRSVSRVLYTEIFRKRCSYHLSKRPTPPELPHKWRNCNGQLLAEASGYIWFCNFQDGQHWMSPLNLVGSYPTFSPLSRPPKRPRRLFSSPLPCPHEHLLPDPDKLRPGKERNALCCPDFPPGKQLEKSPFQIIVPNDRTICFAAKVTK